MQNCCSNKKGGIKERKIFPLLDFSGEACRGEREKLEPALGLYISSRRFCSAVNEVPRVQRPWHAPLPQTAPYITRRLFNNHYLRDTRYPTHPVSATDQIESLCGSIRAVLCSHPAIEKKTLHKPTPPLLSPLQQAMQPLLTSFVRIKDDSFQTLRLSKVVIFSNTRKYLVSNYH